MNKTILKVLCLIAALSLVFTLASCNDGNDAPVTATHAPETTQSVEAESAEATEAESAETTEAESAETTEAESAETTEAESAEATEAESTEAAPAGDMTKAEFVAYFNSETAKIAKGGSYSVNRVCEYTNPVDVGGATDILNGIITAIDKTANLNTVVGGFIGIGTTKGNVPADSIDNDYKVKATVLKEADLGSFTAENGVYTFTLANAKNPQKDNSTPLSRYTNDFFTLQEVNESIAEFTTAVKVEDATADYTDIKVVVTVEEGKITKMTYTYKLAAVLNLKAAFVPITGTGAGVANASYTNITY